MDGARGDYKQSLAQFSAPVAAPGSPGQSGVPALTLDLDQRSRVGVAIHMLRNYQALRPGKGNLQTLSPVAGHATSIS
jgi:hypothetical protein